MADTKKAFWEAKNTGFAEADPSDEFLHLEARENEPGAALTETQFFGFSIPEHDIHSLTYLWHHANLGVVSGGAWVWQGIKHSQIACEIFDWHNWIDDSVLSNDLCHFKLPNSYEVEVLEPLEQLRIRYSDEERGNSFDIGLEAVAKPMVLETGFHLEQPMRTKGSLRLTGTEYEVDGYHVRDRSWGQLRHETLSPLPPVEWMTCVFDDELAFGTTAFDSEDRDPDWKGKLSVPGGDPLRGGWIWHDGDYSPVVSVSKRVQRDEATLLPESVDMKITDASGLELDVRGEIIAASPFSSWPNMVAIISLTRWQCDGRVGYGDTQSVLYGDYVRKVGGLVGGTHQAV